MLIRHVALSEAEEAFVRKLAARVSEPVTFADLRVSKDLTTEVQTKKGSIVVTADEKLNLLHIAAANDLDAPGLLNKYV